MAARDSHNKLSWRVETVSTRSMQDYRDFWGDEYNWTALLPLAWKSFEAPYFSIRPDLREQDTELRVYQAASYWATAIHLLGLGMGWTQIGHGLRIWRENRYITESHPILDFIWRSYGEEIRALEVYFGVSERYLIFEALSKMSDSPLAISTPLTDRSEYYEWERQFSSGSTTRSPLAEALLAGGDALHLEHHVVDSFTPNEMESYFRPQVKNSNSPYVFDLEFGKYAGWGLLLSQVDELKKFSEDGFREDLEVNVRIRTLGHIGRFMHHNTSGRWFLFSDDFGAPSLQWSSHMWGNPEN
jgi:hypothetical protein